MHAHEFMRRSLLDLNNHLYRIALTEAIAGIDTIRLPHRQIWLDPGIPLQALEIIDRRSKEIRHTQQRIESIVNFIGYSALAWLAFNLLVLLI